MITDLPTSQDFQESGIGFLNLAWESAIDLLLELKEWKVEGADELSCDEYWKAAFNTRFQSDAFLDDPTRLVLPQLAAVRRFPAAHSRPPPRGSTAPSACGIPGSSRRARIP
jgi:hypothetical protein